MRPYLYILAVLLVGGGIGYFVGKRSSTFEYPNEKASSGDENDERAIGEILGRWSESYRLHDAMLLFRDCSNSYVEIDGNSGEGRGLQKSTIAAYEFFKAGQSISLNLRETNTKLARNSATVEAKYSKTSELFEKEGLNGLLGKGLWIMSKVNGKWQVQAFCYTEEPKR